MDFHDINLAIIGAGRWGMNHVRTAAKLLKPSNITVCDVSPNTQDKLRLIDDGIHFTSNFEDILVNNRINATIVATPAETHYEVAKKLLLSKKNVLVEKPITLFSKEAEELDQLAEENNCKLSYINNFRISIVCFNKCFW